MTKRKFHRTVIQVEVLSEDPLDRLINSEDPSCKSTQLSAIDYLITEGGCSGEVKTIREQELNGKQAAKAMLNQGSDPSFFNLDHHGDELD
jgi:hypothetical protein